MFPKKNRFRRSDTRSSISVRVYQVSVEVQPLDLFQVAKESG